MSLAALTQYTMTQPPPPNPFLKLPENLKAALFRNTSDPTVPTLSSLDSKSIASKSEPAIAPVDASTDKRTKNKRPPSRKLIRHLLRARVDATRQLAAFLKKIDRPGVKVSASGFMASAFGGGQESLFKDVGAGTDARYQTSDGKEVPGAVGTEVDLNPTGWRYGQEVVRYLKDTGANVGKLLREADSVSGAEGEGEYDFVALSSDGEASPSSPDSGYGASTGKAEELEWVAPGRK